ncbi:hypothetical protein PR048_013517 [Dryococelus australis]|uniref:Uncharacterized protein n=1 Tax=Dryococelus australis TaxID=614101 RepID=A0ABQ9HST8_9NEOP|nr:hypothetical protein PR048_013517 [Dryococelus australis]
MMDLQRLSNSLANLLALYHASKTSSYGVILRKSCTNYLILAAIGTVDEGMLVQTWQYLEYRFDMLRETKGAHVEV